MNYFFIKILKFQLRIIIILSFFNITKIYSQEIPLGKYKTSNTELILLKDNKFEETIWFDVGVVNVGNYLIRNDSLILNYEGEGNLNRKFKILKVKENMMKLRYRREFNKKVEIRTIKMYKTS